MTDSDARRMNAWIDSALDIFQRNQADLAPREIRIRNLLAVARVELEQSLPAEIGSATLADDAASTA